jgi:hypothetical protein
MGVGQGEWQARRMTLSEPPLSCPWSARPSLPPPLCPRLFHLPSLHAEIKLNGEHHSAISLERSTTHDKRKINTMAWAPAYRRRRVRRSLEGTWRCDHPSSRAPPCGHRRLSQLLQAKPSEILSLTHTVHDSPSLHARLSHNAVLRRATQRKRRTEQQHPAPCVPCSHSFESMSVAEWLMHKAWYFLLLM